MAEITALKQLSLLALSFNNLELAETALHNLSCKSITYLPKLAHLYKIQKRYKDALDAYTDYLDIFPEDTLILLKLGALYEELENYEAANFIYQHILSFDPSNMTAKNLVHKLKKT